MLRQTEDETVSYVYSRSQRKNISPESFRLSRLSLIMMYLFRGSMSWNPTIKNLLGNGLRLLVPQWVQFKPLCEMINHDQTVAISLGPQWIFYNIHCHQFSWAVSFFFSDMENSFCTNHLLPETLMARKISL